MNVPPIILSESESGGGTDPEKPADLGLKRNLMGWAALLLMFLLVLWNALSGSLAPSNAAQSLELDKDLKRVVSHELRKQSSLGGFSLLDDSDSSLTLASLERTLAKRANLDLLGRAVYAAVLTEEKKPVPASVYGPLLKGKEDTTRALGKIYSSRSLTRSEAQGLRSRLASSNFFVAKLATAQGLEKAGQKGVRKDLVQEPSFGVIAIVALGAVGLFAGCLCVSMAYIVARNSGQLRPMGLLNERITLADADRFAVRAAQLLAGFLTIGVIVGVFFGKAASAPLPSFVQAFAMLGFVYVLFKLPVNGLRISLADLGIQRGHLGMYVLWGFGGFLVELPVAMFLSVVVTAVLKFLPAPEHPASEQLQLNHDPLTVISILLLGAVVAPIWEEIMFRGLLFPALSRVCKGVPTGAILSSLIFASIHPQGIALWLALGTTGLMSCALSYQTRSLVPSIFMHLFHNASLMILTILVS